LLLILGPSFYETAAKALLRAIQIYPDPVQLLMILQQSIPEPVFQIVLRQMQEDIKGDAPPENAKILEEVEE
jgi:import receptor subunit TOM20